VLKVRAVLSWNQTPPPDNPDWIPPWGNRIEALIQPKPMPTGPVPNQPVPDITSVGDMAVMKIDANGYANGTAVVSGFEADDSPFGGMVNISGHIYNAPNLSIGETALKYCVYYREVGSPYWNKITNKFEITLTKWDGSASTQTSPDQEVDTDGYYTYREDLATDLYISPPDLTQTYVEGDVLAKWYTQGLTDGLYEIKFSVKNPSGDVDSNIVKIRLDNTRPDANVTITAVVSGGVTSTASPCGTFTPPEIIKGEYTAADDHFKNFTLTIQPAKYNPNPVNPGSGTTGGTDQPWELSTGGMTPCGYTINLNVYDRTIVNSGYIGWHSYASDGFCIQ
jgi:hypothetical protein